MLGLVVSLAASLHFLATLSFQGNPIRVALSDLLLPVMLLFPLVGLLRRKGLPELRIKYGWIWLLILTLWLGVGFFNGFFYMGEIQTWSLVNKIIGWFVLAGYFLCGVWLGNRKWQEASAFLIVFMGAGGVIALYVLISHWLFLYGFDTPMTGRVHRVRGFSANPNAFGILMACIFMLQVPFVQKEIFFNKKVHYIILSLILLTVYYSLSRSAWLGLIFAIIGIFFLKRELMKTIIFSICGFVLANLLFFESPHYINNLITKDVVDNGTIIQNKVPVLEKPGRNTIPPDNADAVRLNKNKDHQRIIKSRTDKDPSFQIRVTMLKEAFDYWLEKPVLGIGLGAYYWRHQAGENISHEYQIHNTAIWLLVETGLIGLLLFAGFFICCAARLVDKKSRLEPLSIGVAGVLLVMLGASIGTEILYQRYLWFLLGLALAVVPQGHAEHRS